ncbi:hypothetical protein OH491_05105 [Termitidicoccus mucosus]|uniref:Uncharacterized protein n=1 Tax=Termitidicoccus mucosus TaxID=1184151 RepID=A0A178IML2_9BACT|nr:hypothetical protein AW736_04485 [Opitutaceae bacterium TSB47]
MPPQRGQFFETCQSMALIAESVLPEPVSPVTNQPRQKSFNDHENPPRVRTGFARERPRAAITPHATCQTANAPHATCQTANAPNTADIASAAPGDMPARRAKNVQPRLTMARRR